jgi:hypothetical protein
MRNLVSITTEYIRSSRSIDVIQLVGPNSTQQIYVYNFEGLQYHYFDSLIRLIRFFEMDLEANASFDSGAELDDYLEKICRVQ